MSSNKVEKKGVKAGLDKDDCRKNRAEAKVQLQREVDLHCQTVHPHILRCHGAFCLKAPSVDMGVLINADHDPCRHAVMPRAVF